MIEDNLWKTSENLLISNGYGVHQSMKTVDPMIDSGGSIVEKVLVSRLKLWKCAVKYAFRC